MPGDGGSIAKRLADEAEQKRSQAAALKRLEELQANLDSSQAERDHAIGAALAAGCTAVDISAITGISRARVPTFRPSDPQGPAQA